MGQTAEKKREYNRRYQADHREEISANKRAYYRQHRDEICAKRREYRQENRSRLSEENSRRQSWFTRNLDIIRHAQGCDACGTHEGRLVHHHIDPATKVRKGSEMDHSSLEALLDEIAKCCVLCDSCHAQVHERWRNFRDPALEPSTPWMHRRTFAGSPALVGNERPE